MSFKRLLSIVILSAGAFSAFSAAPAPRKSAPDAKSAPAAKPTPAGAVKTPPPPQVSLLPKFLNGPMAGVEEIVFAVRGLGRDGHWYANFAYHVYGPQATAYGPDGGKLRKLNLRTGKVTDLLDDPKGAVRDPQVHYDGKRIVFSYRKGGSANYHLYQINSDGSALRQLTDGPRDDIEATYTPDGDIIFASSRCNRWVNCWLTQVAILYRCDANGGNIRPISCNGEQENTPWMLPDGRVLYMRWEYVDRNQVTFHHLWTINPDGTGQMTYFGNMHPGTAMLDAKPIPGTHKVVASFSPGHGQKEHAGFVAVVDPDAGPDEQGFARNVSKAANWRDPYAFSEDCFLVAAGASLHVMDGRGNTEVIYTLPDELKPLQVHEPRPLVARPREAVIPPRTDPAKESGTLILADVALGRNMAGVRPGEIRKLLVVEVLPMPVHYSGGMEPISLGGTFTLESVLGTVPVEPDGSASFEVPALRSVFFVAMDANDNAIKRMQSFVSVMPGERTSCTGCHERRTNVPGIGANLLALKRPPSRIQPVPDIPDVFDFPRDIQPILDRHCLKCHDYDKRDGGAILSGDRGPMYSHSYYALMSRDLIADGRNGYANRPPRTIGASASRLMKLLDPNHYDVKLSDRERNMVRYWIESGAAYPGTYAAPGCGSIGLYIENQLQRIDADWPGTVASRDVLRRRCSQCHDRGVPLPESPSQDVRGHTRHLVFNLTRPEKSLMLLAPLARTAGGYGTCKPAAAGATSRPAAEVFADTSDADYQKLLSAIRDAKKWLDENKRFDMPGFRPTAAYVREMKKYGILPASFDPGKDPIDVYALDREYWKSFWYVPPSK